jgi:hypothetical protein
MTEKMTVLYVKKTGHVLAALTRVGAPEGKITKEVLVGQALPFRVMDETTKINIAQFNVPTEELDILAADLDPELLLWHSQYSVDEEQKFVRQITQAITTIDFTTSTVSIDLGMAAIDTKVKVRVQIESGNLNKPIIINDKEATVTPASPADPTGPLTAKFGISPPLQGGEKYRFLTLAAGYSPQAKIIPL